MSKDAPRAVFKTKGVQPLSRVFAHVAPILLDGVLEFSRDGVRLEGVVEEQTISMFLPLEWGLSEINIPNPKTTVVYAAVDLKAIASWLRNLGTGVIIEMRVTDTHFTLEFTQGRTVTTTKMPLLQLDTLQRTEKLRVDRCLTLAAGQVDAVVKRLEANALECKLRVETAADGSSDLVFVAVNGTIEAETEARMHFVAPGSFEDLLEVVPSKTESKVYNHTGIYALGVVKKATKTAALSNDVVIGMGSGCPLSLVYRLGRGGYLSFNLFSNQELQAMDLMASKEEQKTAAEEPVPPSLHTLPPISKGNEEPGKTSIKRKRRKKKGKVRSSEELGWEII